MKYVVYGDTDSSYINIPQIKPINNQDALEKATEISIEINKNVKLYLDKILLPKMGIDPIYNHITFKTELVAIAMLLLDIKKNYAYKMVVDEGKILSIPKIKYTNLSVTKSDIPKFTKDFITRLVEDILFHPEFEYATFKNKISALTIEMHDKLKTKLNNYDYFEISVPKKWGLNQKADTFQIRAMKLYNTLVNKKIFKPMAAGLILPLTVSNYSDLEMKLSSVRNNNELYINDVPIIKIEKIAIPYNYEKETLIEIFKYYKINIDFEECWNLLLNKTLRRLIAVSKL
jgi:hypothetical protein